MLVLIGNAHILFSFFARLYVVVFWHTLCNNYCIVLCYWSQLPQMHPRESLHPAPGHSVVRKVGRSV